MLPNFASALEKLCLTMLPFAETLHFVYHTQPLLPRRKEGLVTKANDHIPVTGLMLRNSVCSIAKNARLSMDL